jgi:hypothetical protein
MASAAVLGLFWEYIYFESTPRTMGLIYEPGSSLKRAFYRPNIYSLNCATQFAAIDGSNAIAWKNSWHSGKITAGRVARSLLISQIAAQRSLLTISSMCHFSAVCHGDHPYGKA